MNIESTITEHLAQGIASLFGATVAADELALSPTKKDFEGTFTFVTFPYSKIARKRPDEVAQLLGNYLKENVELIADFNVVKGFLNLVIDNSVWVKTLANIQQCPTFGMAESTGQKVMVEYSSPNTNKPLHLGHLRNNFLGHSLCCILEAAGHDVFKVNLVNDRGIHICKSMLAYQKFGNGETPESSGIKGDKLVGKYYVIFDKTYKAQVAEKITELQATMPNLAGLDIKELKDNFAQKGKKEKLDEGEKALMKSIKTITEKAEKEAPIQQEAKAMLLKWEQGDKEVVDLWKTMNGWVFDGFDATYKRMGVEFDKFYYESNTYLLGKDIVEEGLQKGIFFKKEDGSVWIDLTDEGLDEKLVLRADGTSVYMTQDIGTADLKYSDYPMQQSVYVVGNEQEYHFKVLKLIMQRLGRAYADGIYHLSYGMVDLPEGKMKSREGTVVDADDLIQEMVDTARERTKELGKIDDFTAEEAAKLYEQLALGAVKYYLLRVDPSRRMLFNPKESIDFQGNTGVYIQYTHAKINAILRKAQQDGIDYAPSAYASIKDMASVESDVVTQLANFPAKVQEAASNYAPSVIANYIYDLAKMYSKFYSELSIFGEEDTAKKALRIALSGTTAQIINKGLALIGVEAPERM